MYYSRFKAVPTLRAVKPQEITGDNCGIGNCSPRWLQRFANPKLYLFIFSALAILQGAYFTYFVGVITTLEKRFSFRSKVTAYIMVAENVSPIIACILIGYLGGKMHKPKMITVSMLLVVVGCFLSCLPYFLYGPGLHILSKPDESLEDNAQDFCLPGKGIQKCDLDYEIPDNSHPAVLMLFIANFLNGFGYVAFYIVGATYLDDNVKKKNSPLYFGKRYIPFSNIGWKLLM